MLDYSICTWDEEVVDILEECNVAPVLDPDDENFDECFDILPPLLGKLYDVCISLFFGCM